MTLFRVLTILAGLPAFMSAAAHAAAAPTPFADWAVVVAAGDFRAHSGAEAEIFDNARRDVAKGLTEVGFSAGNILQFSIRPERYPDTQPLKTELNLIYERLSAKAQTAKAGCLFYFTSHGAAEQGAVIALDNGQYGVAPPAAVDAILTNACPNRPVIAVISACFSGYYVPTLAKADRVILTAARADRTSFGCGEMDKYPYFDDCFISTLKIAPDFAALGRAVQTCVAAKEDVLRRSGTEEVIPSEPQFRVGGALAPMLPFYAFRRSTSAP